MGRFLRVAGMTDVGQEREHNEDSFGLMQQFDLFIVADGMGGHRAGDVASSMAITAVEEFFLATEKEDITWPFHFDPNLPFAVNRLVTAVQVANSRIHQESIKNTEHQGMGTTAVGIHFVKDYQACHIAHVGDSRCYRVRDNVLELLTVDHSLINDYLKAAPDLSEEQLAELPRNVITRALGMQESVLVDVQTQETMPGDIFLLCSDGLNGMLIDEEISEVMNEKSEDIEAAGNMLIELANVRGGEDNVTVILAQVAEE
ncbi:MAG: Stp1/IreP family PP2C-type Ser/Thr phosphatase [Deltaproteobacteria bacterium]|nr:Stp1/IreP family PP2C-type Ser/Thr phosphatase [Deltaproteobacteria bacterium]